MPFCATLYNQDKFENLTDVIAPPFDKITPAERRFLISRTEYNVSRLIVGQEKIDGYYENEFYESVPKLIKKWIRDGILEHTTTPALYYLVQYFQGPDSICHIRKGFIALIPIEDYATEKLYPLSRLSDDVIKDRLRLLKASKTNFNQIFFAYQDPENRINKILDEAQTRAIKTLHAEDETNGVRNILYVIQEEDVIQEVQSLMATQSALVTDGYFRLETIKQFRDEHIDETGIDQTDADYTMGYFACTNDFGSKIYPTHRVLHDIPDFSDILFKEKLKKYFSFYTIDYEDIRIDNEDMIITFVEKDGTVSELELNNEGKALLKSRIENPALSKLDTVILNEIVLKEIMQMSNETIQNTDSINYHFTLESFWEDIRGNGQAGFILNYPNTTLIYELATNGIQLPRHTTYFFPKLSTGLVMREMED